MLTRCLRCCVKKNLGVGLWNNFDEFMIKRNFILSTIQFLECMPPGSCLTHGTGGAEFHRIKHYIRRAQIICMKGTKFPVTKLFGKCFLALILQSKKQGQFYIIEVNNNWMLFSLVTLN